MNYQFIIRSLMTAKSSPKNSITWVKTVMSQRLKRWESPRKEGRNDKGKGGSARQRQKKKQLQMLRKKLKEGINPKPKRDGASAISFWFSEKVAKQLSLG
jgi:hypothetical protein